MTSACQTEKITANLKECRPRQPSTSACTGTKETCHFDNLEQNASQISCNSTREPAHYCNYVQRDNQHRSPLISRADQFEQNAGFHLILGDIGEIVANQQVILVELGDSRLEYEIASRDLEFLHELGGSSG
jgi:hypothetical protein